MSIIDGFLVVEVDRNVFGGKFGCEIDTKERCVGRALKVSAGVADGRGLKKEADDDVAGVEEERNHTPSLL
jgi:hypothetical protein